ncbi:hypothetical protein Tco_0541033 [Tanacetum coccineum]
MDEEDDEVTKELYNDVNVNLGNRNADMTDADQGGTDQQNVSQESGFEQVEEDDHVTLTPVLDTQNTNEPTSSLYTVQVTAIPEVTSIFTTTIPPPPPFFNLLLQQATPTLTPITSEATTSFPSLLDFSSVFKFNDRDIVAHNLDCREEAQAEKRDYIELVDISIRVILKEEVNNQLPRIIPQAVSDFAIHVIEKNVTKSLEAAVLARSSSQPKSTYEAAASLSEFELTKILIDKMEKNKSYDKADYKWELYDALVKSYQADKDLFDTYGEVFTLKRSQDDRDKDQDPSAGSNRGTKRRKSSKEAESSRDSRSKEKKSSSTSKDASHSQHKPSGNSAHVEETSHTVDDSKAGWFKKPERPPTPDSDWNKRQHVDFRPPQTWISQVSRTKEPRTSFDELIDTLFDFSAFVLNRLNIKDLTQEILVGSAFKILKGTCKSLTELEYHLEECSKATTERLNWHNPKGKSYPFDLSKPLPLIPDHRGRQVIPHDFYINNDLEYLKGGDLRRWYSTSITKIKAATYEIKWIEDLGLKRQRFDGFARNMTSSKDVYSRKRIIVVTRLTIMKKYDYVHLEEIDVRREDEQLYKFGEVLSSQEESREVPSVEVKPRSQEKEAPKPFLGVRSSKPSFDPFFIPLEDAILKVMHAYYAKESPIPPPTIMPPSTMLSPMFNPQEFFLPEELLSPKKQGHNQSFSSTSALPQEFKMGESSPELQKAHARIAKLQRKQMGNNNQIALARFRIATLEQIIEEIQVRYQADKKDSECNL